MKRLFLTAGVIVCLAVAIYSFHFHSSAQPHLSPALAGSRSRSAPIVPARLATVIPASTAGAEHLTDPRSDALFRAALQDYGKGSYARAVDGFYKASAIDPSAPAPHFYLGVSYLLTGDVAAGIRELHLTAILGEKTYGERAHYYLAQALWRQHEATRAQAELDIVIAADGTLKKDAQILKGEMDAVDRQTR